MKVFLDTNIFLEYFEQTLRLRSTLNTVMSMVTSQKT